MSDVIHNSIAVYHLLSTKLRASKRRKHLVKKADRSREKVILIPEFSR